MLLPTTLEATTLGDVLGRLHRHGVSGVLRLCEDGERIHEIELCEGWIERVSVARAGILVGDILVDMVGEPALFAQAVHRAIQRCRDPRPLGERLVAVRAVAPAQVIRAVTRLHGERLEHLFQLRRARIQFRPLRRRLARGCGLGPVEFLHGRRRTREGEPGRAPGSSGARVVSGRAQALQTLGLSDGASCDAIRQAFRRAVSFWHPDRFVQAEPSVAHDAADRFRQLTASYQLLVPRQ